MSATDLKRRIEELQEEWWKEETLGTFLRIGRAMQYKGIEEDVIIDWLQDLLVACGNEYGD